MFYDVNKSKEFERKWTTETEGTKVELVTQYIIVSEQGAALNVETNDFISKWYNVPDSAPHITLLVDGSCK